MRVSIGIVSEDNRGGRTKPQCFRLEFAKCLAERENDPRPKFLGNLENGATTGYMSDLGNCPEVFTDVTKLRVIDEKRQILGNYKTSVGKEEYLQ